jgi:hypothetical protein
MLAEQRLEHLRTLDEPTALGPKLGLCQLGRVTGPLDPEPCRVKSIVGGNAWEGAYVPAGATPLGPRDISQGRA